MKPALFDGFVLANLALWGLGARFLFRRPLAFHRAELSLAELFLYASLIALVLALIWSRLRRLPWRPALLALVQGALLTSIAGFAVIADGRRLYDCSWLSLPFDKIVHFLCAAVAALGVGALFSALGLRFLRLEGTVVVLVVLGGGAIWEILEYLVKTVFTDVGVGAYDNNMQDLVANLVGGLFARALPARWRHALERVPER
jgi:hypothetical protein